MGPHKSYIKFPRAAVDQPWSVPELAAAYHFPNGTLLGGGVIAIGELGGGWTAVDLKANFDAVGQPVPTIVDVSVGGALKSPSPGDPADVEVMLDIVCAAQAYYYLTGKIATIRMYWAPNDAVGIPDATMQASDDGCDVLSWSWGQDEAGWGPAALGQMEATAVYAVGRGMVVTAAAGDNDSSDGGPGRANVDAPASCPHVVGCGGTTRPHNIASTKQETVWNSGMGEGTGGGFSKYFPMPAWMNGAPHGSGRMVPDLAACADPATGYKLFVHGQWTVIGGTSAVAPLMAGYFAALGKKLGFVLPKMWMNHMAFSDVVRGNNGAYRAHVGPDPCSGLGVPRGDVLASVFK
jgi:subtilase family serine protease